MGFYQQQLLPRLQNKIMDRKDMREVRGRVCSGLSGEIVEVGFGTGLNTPFYPATVAKVAAVEPSELCMRIAQTRIARSSTAVEFAGLTGESLDLPSGAFDAALSTWTLCTIPNVDVALGEIHRVLKPGGTFRFVEHGHAPDGPTASWQARIEPTWKRIAGGCHLTRRIPDLIETAGFRIDKLDAYYMKGEPKPFGYTYEGVASKP